MTDASDTPRFTWWMTPSRAKSFGCTHHARLFGIIPGFCSMDHETLWVSRSDALNLVEDLVAAIWSATQSMLGHEPSFMFSVGREIR